MIQQACAKYSGMRNLYPVLILFFLMTGCNQNSQQNVPGVQDTLPQQKDTLANVVINKKKDSNSTEKKDAVSTEKKDTVLLRLSADILKYLKTKNFKQLAAFIHPEGVQFSPYGNIDTARDQKLSAAQLMSFSQGEKKILWGIYDGTGGPINLSLSKYLKKFVYDVDFLTAEKRSVNKTEGPGNSLNSLQSIYPGCDFTEFYFPGFNPKYDGMDWRAIRLVFKKENDKYYLVGVIHDQWTI